MILTAAVRDYLHTPFTSACVLLDFFSFLFYLIILLCLKMYNISREARFICAGNDADLPQVTFLVGKFFWTQDLMLFCIS